MQRVPHSFVNKRESLVRFFILYKNTLAHTQPTHSNMGALCEGSFHFPTAAQSSQLRARGWVRRNIFCCAMQMYAFHLFPPMFVEHAVTLGVLRSMCACVFTYSHIHQETNGKVSSDDIVWACVYVHAVCGLKFLVFALSCRHSSPVCRALLGQRARLTRCTGYFHHKPHFYSWQRGWVVKKRTLICESSLASSPILCSWGFEWMRDPPSKY